MDDWLPLTIRVALSIYAPIHPSAREHLYNYPSAIRVAVGRFILPGKAYESVGGQYTLTNSLRLTTYHLSVEATQRKVGAVASCPKTLL